MKPLVIKDNGSLKKTEFSQVEKLTKKIVDKDFQELEEEGVFIFPETIADLEDIDYDQFVLKSVNDKYVTGNVVGFLGLEKERLIIGSRFDNKDKGYFLQYLLGRVFEFPNVFDLESELNQEERLFEFFLFLFPYYLKQALCKGVYKQYVRIRYNNDCVRGLIDVARHIKTNTPFVGKVAYSQRELTIDNPVMELIRHTIEFMKTKSVGKTLLSRIKDEVEIVKGATPAYRSLDRQKVIYANKKNTVQHAFYREYSNLQRLCLLILTHQKHKLGSGRNRIYGILFDAAWLWEEYINLLIERDFYHPRNKGKKSDPLCQWLFDGKQGRIYPDFIGKNKENRLIADAKYKCIEGIHGHSYLQLLAYMLRFSAKTGYFIYPESSNTSGIELKLNEGVSLEGNVRPRKDLVVIKLGLKIPQSAETYDDFVNKIRENEEEFKNSILQRHFPSGI